MSNEIERELGWDDQIENDGNDFTILPAGDYDFEVVSFERGRHNGSDKLPPCNKATYGIRIDGDEYGTTTINHNLFLHSKTEGMVCAFFTGIGQRKKGESIKPDWNAAVGAKGRCKISVKEWKSNKSGEMLQGNEIKKFYEPSDTPPAAPGSFTAGKF